MTIAAVLNDRERFPAISDLSALYKLRQHPMAPVFNFKSGDRLTPEDIRKVQEYRETMKQTPAFWEQGQVPDWVDNYVTRCFKNVPFYKNRRGTFLKQPSIRREDLRQKPWAFVDDACNPNDLLVYDTSGTTGPPLPVLFDRITQATYLPQLESILDRVRVTLPKGKDQVAVALICSQKQTLTYASLSGYLDGAGILKINLHPDHWRDNDHRTGFLESVKPQILTGDPFAFTDLMRLRPAIRPKALVSSAMALLPGLKQELESFFKCPVIDVYSLTECRMVAEATDHGHRLIRHDVFVEILEPDRDVPVAPGEQGELVLTGGNNPFLNLIRYRTGDFCHMHWENKTVYLRNFQGRSPVVFEHKTGSRVNSVDIARAFCHLNVSAYNLHQHTNGALELSLYGGSVYEQTLLHVLEELFGSLPVHIVRKDRLPEGAAKIIPFSNDGAQTP